MRGVCAERLQLDSGAFAVVTRERTFSLVPWREVIEPHRGREVRGMRIPTMPPSYSEMISPAVPI